MNIYLINIKYKYFSRLLFRKLLNQTAFDLVEVFAPPGELHHDLLVAVHVAEARGVVELLRVELEDLPHVHVVQLGVGGDHGEGDDEPRIPVTDLLHLLDEVIQFYLGNIHIDSP